VKEGKKVKEDGGRKVKDGQDGKGGRKVKERR
jgi:hypothetical protein